MRRAGRSEDRFHVVGVAERLAPYDVSGLDAASAGQTADPDLVERAATLLTVMPRNQHRGTIEELLAPHDPDRGRRAVDALIDAGLVVEDINGCLRLKGSSAGH